MCARVDVYVWMRWGVHGRVCKDEVVYKVVYKLGKEKLSMKVCACMCGGERGFVWIKVEVWGVWAYVRLHVGMSVGVRSANTSDIISIKTIVEQICKSGGSARAHATDGVCGGRKIYIHE